MMSSAGKPRAGAEAGKYEMPDLRGKTPGERRDAMSTFKKSVGTLTPSDLPDLRGKTRAERLTAIREYKMSLRAK